MSKLHVGCGARVETGWVNVDLEPFSPSVTKVDVRRGLPFEANTFEMIYSEHFLEHIERHEAEIFLADCYRVLRPGGALRISMPDMQFLAELYIEALRHLDPIASEVPFVVAGGHPIQGDPLDFYKPVGWAPRDPAELINGGMRLWDHRCIWDYYALATTLLGLGFDLVGRAPYGRTRYAGMITEGRPDLHELIVECQKPDVAHASAR